MKKILMSLLVIGVIGALIGGGAFAAFSDTETSTSNSFTAGTLDLEVDSENPWASTKISTSSLKPGDSGAVDIALENSGNLSGSLTVNLTSITDAENTRYEPETEDGDTTDDTGEMGANMDIVVWVDDGTGGGTANNGTKDGTEQQLYSGTLAAATTGPWSVTGGLAASGTTYIGISYSIDSSVTDVIQSDSTSFTIAFALAQS